MTRYTHLTTCASWLAIGLAAPAAAQVPPVAPGAPTATAVPADVPTEGLQDIVVTANKNPSTAQRTPVAIAVVSGARLEQAGVTSVADLVKVAPAIQFTPIRQKAITYIRGVGQGISGGNADPAVAINLNDAYLPSEMSNLGFFDVERVEVLYGPQGTLYGRNAVGGAINVITRRPGKDLGADASIEVGNYNSLLVNGGVDLPVSPTLGFRLAGLRNQHDGYFSNGLSDADLWALRLTGVYQPGPRTTITAIGSYSQQRGLGEGAQNLPPATSDPWYLPFDARAVPLFIHADSGTASLEIAQELGDHLTLTSISGFAKTAQHTNFLAYLNQPGNVQFVNYNIHVDDYTQEFRLTGKSERFNWIAGLYGYDTENGELSQVRPQILPALTFVVGPWQQHAEGAAVFGQVTYSVTDTLRATGGFRYSYDKRHLYGTNINYLNTGAPRPAGTVAYDGTRSDNRPDFKAGLEYDLAPRSLLYATFQTGYNNGGFSTAQATLGSTAAAPFAPMTVESYTVGSKNRFFGSRLQLNAELFYNDYKNYQVSARSLQTGQVTVFNAAKAETYGAQFDGRAQLTDHDELGATLSLLHAKFKTLVIPTAPFNLAGFDMPLAPRVTLNIDYTHQFPLPAGARIDLSGDYRHVSSEWGVYTHATGSLIDAYDMGDASVTYFPPSQRWSFGAFVRNVTDKFTPAFVLSGAIPGPGSGFPLPPRTYGVRLTAKL